MVGSVYEMTPVELSYARFPLTLIALLASESVYPAGISPNDKTPLPFVFKTCPFVPSEVG